MRVRKFTATVAAILMMAAPGLASERFGGIEVGAKGVKVSAVEVDAAGPSLRVLSLDRATEDVTISRIKNRVFSEVSIDEVAAVVADFGRALQEKLNVPEANIEVVASSGVPFAKNFTDLAAAIRDRTGKPLNKLNPAEEATLTALAIVPAELRSRVLVVDIGSGNTKGGGYAESSGQFIAFDIPFGTTTLSQRIAATAEGTDPVTLDVADGVALRDVGGPLRDRLSRNPELANRDLVLLSGGSVWAMMTLLRPETAANSFPPVTMADVRAYRDLIRQAGGGYPEPRFPRVTDAEALKVAHADDNAIRGATGKKPVFRPAELQASAALLGQVGEILIRDGRTVLYDRKAVTAWITARITPAAYRGLLPQALDRDFPPIPGPKPTSPTESERATVTPSPQCTLPTPVVVGTIRVIECSTAIPSSPLDLRDRLLVGKTCADWEGLFQRGLSAYQTGDPEALEYFAASAELGDDPAAWTYLALALLRRGDVASAQQAIRYSASTLDRSPERPLTVSRILQRMHEPSREQIIAWYRDSSVSTNSLATRELRPALRRMAQKPSANPVP